MQPSQVIPMDKFAYSIKLWYHTNLLHGIWWAGFGIANQEDKLSFNTLTVSIIIVLSGAVVSTPAIPCAIPLFAYALPLSKTLRIITVALVIPALWALSAALMLLIPTYVPQTICSFLSYTLPSLGAAYLAAAYVYRVWLFRP